MKQVTLTIIFSSLLFCSAEAQEISEWREENRTGVSAETGLLKSWPAEGPKLLWENLELTEGFSSVSFGKNSIYITGLKDDEDILYSLDMNGKLLWQTTMGRSWNESYPESRATPTVEGNMVYTTSGFGDLACIDGTTGTILWSYKASEINKGTYGRWGIAESLLIDGDKLYFSPGGSETMTIALKKATGELLWKSASLNDKPGYLSPILVDYAGKKMIINVSLGHVFAVDASNGDILWQVAHEQKQQSGRPSQAQGSATGQTPPVRRPAFDPIKCVTPLFHNGNVYVTGGYNAGGMMIHIADNGKSADTLWTDNVLDVHHGGVVLIDGYIYGSNWINNGDGNWCCIDWNTGKKMYEEHWQCKGSVIAGEGMLYVYDEKYGNVGLVKATPEKFDLVSSFKISNGTGPYWAHPVIHNRILYIRHGKTLMAYNISND